MYGDALGPAQSVRAECALLIDCKVEPGPCHGVSRRREPRDVIDPPSPSCCALGKLLVKILEASNAGAPATAQVDGGPVRPAIYGTVCA